MLCRPTIVREDKTRGNRQGQDNRLNGRGVTRTRASNLKVRAKGGTEAGNRKKSQQKEENQEI